MFLALDRFGTRERIAPAQQLFPFAPRTVVKVIAEDVLRVGFAGNQRRFGLFQRVQDKNVKRRRESFFLGLWISRGLDILRLP